MKKLLFVVILCSYSFTFSQIRFEKGYLINNQDVKSEVLIKNEDWTLNPTEFFYKATESSSRSTGKLKDVKEFGVYNFSKYVRFTGNIDESTDNLQYIDDKKDPIWVEKTIFLKQLVEGNRNLFVYNDPKVRKFFFSDRNTPITQFIYKRYLPNEDQMEVYTNNEFRMQIAKSFSIPSTDKKLQNLPYKESSLIAIFKKHNAMDDSGLKSDNAKSSLNLFVKPGISFSSAKLKVDDGSASNVNFANKAGFRFGIELEYVLPSRKNKWALFVEPIYQNYKQTGENFYNNPAEINYNAIVLSLGFRHYFFVDTDSRIFLEGLTNIVELRMGDNFIHYGIPGTFAEHILETKSGITFGGGIGFSYKNKYLISAQYVAKNLGSNYNFLNIPYNQLSVIAAYNIF